MGEAGVDTLLKPESPHSCFDRSGIAAHDLAAAMGEDGMGHSFILAPAKLRSDRRVADQSFATPAHHRSRDGGSVADIELNVA